MNTLLHWFLIGAVICGTFAQRQNVGTNQREGVGKHTSHVELYF